MSRSATTASLFAVVAQFLLIAEEASFIHRPCTRMTYGHVLAIGVIRRLSDHEAGGLGQDVQQNAEPLHVVSASPLVSSRVVG